MDTVEPAGVCGSCGKGLEPPDPGGDWDGQWMCSDCIRAALVAEFGDRALHPEESYRSGFMEALWRGARSAFIGNTIFAGTLFACFLLIRFAFQLSQVAAGRPFAAPDAKVWLYFLGFSWAFCGIIVFPLIVCWSLTSAKRILCVDDKSLVQKTNFGTLKIPLPECTWYESVRGIEAGRMLFWRRPLLIVYSRGDARQALACGFSDEARRLWAGYFTLTMHSRIPQLRGLGSVLGCVQGLALGGAGGTALGAILHAATGDPYWIVALCMIGFLDGAVWGLTDAAFKAGQMSASIKWRSPVKMDQRLLAVSMICTAAVLGFKLGLLAGIRGGFVCALANAIVGTIGWLWIKPKSGSSTDYSD